MYLIRPPKVYRWLFKEAVFRMEPEEKTVYLTFDDGPHPETTEHVLDVLREHRVKATFFMLGKNVARYPQLKQMVSDGGHAIGNHGMEHPNGWVTSTEAFVADFAAGKAITGSSLFRPPYGRLTLSQYNRIKEDSTIVFWDVISGDFDMGISVTDILNNVKKNVRNGSIIVMHDSRKALKNVRESLGPIITELAEMGFGFSTLHPPR